ncbi:MAG: hypothetical protein J5714_00785 [Alphaproteobacteria bacterium]|nr:hypothetical protein [Alphaproteobacteria bacterium]
MNNQDRIEFPGYAEKVENRKENQLINNELRPLFPFGGVLLARTILNDNILFFHTIIAAGMYSTKYILPQHLSNLRIIPGIISLGYTLGIICLLHDKLKYGIKKILEYKNNETNYIFVNAGILRSMSAKYPEIFEHYKQNPDRIMDERIVENILLGYLDSHATSEAATEISNMFTPESIPLRLKIKIRWIMMRKVNIKTIAKTR